MIKYKITVSNDHRKGQESFEATTLNLDPENEALMKRIQDVVDKFKTEVNEPVEEVEITTKWRM